MYRDNCLESEDAVRCNEDEPLALECVMSSGSSREAQLRAGEIRVKYSRYAYMVDRMMSVWREREKGEHGSGKVEPKRWGLQCGVAREQTGSFTCSQSPKRNGLNWRNEWNRY